MSGTRVGYSCIGREVIPIWSWSVTSGRFTMALYLKVSAGLE